MAREPLEWLTLLAMGIVSAILIAGGIALGFWLDGVLHTSPIFVLIGIAIGLAAAIAYTITRIRPFLKE